MQLGRGTTVWRLLNAVASIALAFASVFATADIASAATCNPQIDISGSTYYLKFTNTAACVWTVPEGIVVNAHVVIAGGGGAGGSGDFAGGGGGGQVLDKTNWKMNPGTEVTIQIGNGGSAPSGIAPGGNGETTTFAYDSTTVRARGGGGGGGSDHNWKTDSSQSPQGQAGGSGGGGSAFSGNTRGVSNAYYNSGWTSWAHSGGLGGGGSATIPITWGAGAGGGGAYANATSTTISYGQSPTSYFTTIGRAGAGIWLLGDCLGGGGDSSYVPEQSSIRASNAHNWLTPPSPIECRKSDGSIVDGSYSGGYGSTGPASNSGGGSAGSSGDNGANGVVLLTYTLDVPNIVSTNIAKTGDSATFNFTGTMTGKFTCWLDGVADTNCKSPVSYNNLDKGGHTFEVAQDDSFGTRSAKTSYDFGLYPAAPTNVILPNAQDPEVVGDNITNNNQPIVQASSLMIGAKVVIRAFDANGNKEFCTFTATSTTQSCQMSRMADGQWTLEAYQEKPNNYESAVKRGEVITIDTNPLGAVSITSDVPAVGAIQPLFEFEGEVGARRFICQIDDLEAFDCTSPYKAKAKLNNGNHTFKVSQVDVAGNISEASIQSFVTLANVGPVPSPEPEETEEPNPEPTKDPEPTQKPSPTEEVTPTETPTPTESATVEPSPTPSATTASIANFGRAVQNIGIGATGDDNAPPQKFDPMSSEAGVKAVTETVTKAVTLVSSVAAAAAGAAAAGAAASAGAGAAAGAGGASSASSSSSAASSSSSAVTTDPTSMDVVEAEGGDTGDLEQMEIAQDALALDPNHRGFGDALAIASASWFTFLDRRSHELVERTSRYSPLMSKIFNDGTYLRAAFGSLSLILPFVGLWLGLVSIGSSPFGVLTPQWQLMLAISILGIFDAFAGLVASLVYLIGTAIMHEGLFDLNDWRLMMGVMLVSMGPSLITTTFRKLRKPSTHGNKGWWERMSDLAIAPFMASWVSGAMVASMPALAGVTLAVANHVADYSAALGIAIFIRVWFEEGVARFFPYRINHINPDHIEDPPLVQRYTALSIKFVLWVIVSGALVGVSWHIFVGAFFALAPTILSWYNERFPNYPKLWRILPVGIPGLALSLAVASVMGMVSAAIFGPSPELAQWSFVILPIPLAALSVAANFGRHDGTGNTDKPVKENLWIYRIGGVIMLAVTLKLAGVY